MSLATAESLKAPHLWIVPETPQEDRGDNLLQFPIKQIAPVRIPQDPTDQVREELGIKGYVSLNGSGVKREFPFTGEWISEDGDALVSVQADMVAFPRVFNEHGGYLDESPISGRPQFVLKLKPGEIEIVHRYIKT